MAPNANRTAGWTARPGSAYNIGIMTAPLLALVVALLVHPALSPGRNQAPPACADRPEFAWLDFWVGEWRVSVGGQQVGANRIEKVLDGCAVTEHWTDARGGAGFSLFFVEPVSGVWQQVWVSDTARAPGGVKQKRLVARLEGGALRFQGEVIVNGAVILDRTTLTPLADGRVRQVIERSADGGETWMKGFDALYTRVTAR